MIVDVTVRRHAVAAHHLPAAAVATTLPVGMTGMSGTTIGMSGITNAVIATMTAGTVITNAMIATTNAVTVNVSALGVQMTGNAISKRTEIDVMTKGKGVMTNGGMVQMEKIGKVSL